MQILVHPHSEHLGQGKISMSWHQNQGNSSNTPAGGLLLTGNLAIIVLVVTK